MTDVANLLPGDRVTYADVNLSDYRGVVEAVRRGPNGGDCIVRWNRPLNATSEECALNLKVLQWGGER